MPTSFAKSDYRWSAPNLTIQVSTEWTSQPVFESPFLMRLVTSKICCSPVPPSPLHRPWHVLSAAVPAKASGVTDSFWETTTRYRTCHGLLLLRCDPAKENRSWAPISTNLNQWLAFWYISSGLEFRGTPHPWEGYTLYRYVHGIYGSKSYFNVDQVHMLTRIKSVVCGYMPHSCVLNAYIRFVHTPIQTFLDDW